MSVVQKFIRARLALAVAAAIPLAGGTALAFENGPPPGFTGGSGDPDCTVCHFDYAANTPGGTLTVAGLPDAFVAGERYTIADITALCAIDFGRVSDIRIAPEQKHLARWHEAVSSRPSAKA